MTTNIYILAVPHVAFASDVWDSVWGTVGVTVVDVPSYSYKNWFVFFYNIENFENDRSNIALTMTSHLIKLNVANPMRVISLVWKYDAFVL